MALSTAQLATIKTHIEASGDMNTQPNDEPGAQTIAALFNAPASPDFWVFRSKITEEEIVGQPSPDASLFNWTTYIQRSQGERDGWMRLFRSGQVNPSLTNVQNAIADIFSGAGGLNQRNHINACFRRKATRLEKLLATGTGSAASPGTAGFEGTITITDVVQARA
jgi:hypothetical protein